MFEITPIRGSNQYAAAHYFSAADDYYNKEGHGLWQGQGAQSLGLTGVIDQTQFARMLAGKLPNGERIQTTFDLTKNKKRMGSDLTFSAPKSVSMQALIGGDKRVIEAHDKAVSQALIQIEKLAQARKKIKGKSTRERTGKLVIGKFRHELSRAKDPQLHTHAVALNMTQRADGEWRALANEDLFVVKHEIDAIYKVSLAKELQAFGYAIRLTDDKGNFELAHISRKQISAVQRQSVISQQLQALWCLEDIGIWNIGPYNIPYFAPPVLCEEVLEASINNVRVLQKEVSIPFLAELPSCSFLAGDMPLEEFFTRLINSTRCNMVLDVSHVFSYAIYTGKHPQDVLAALPLASVVEIHIAGGSVHPAHSWRYRDTHTEPILDGVIGILKQALLICPNLRAITYEIGYGIELKLVEQELERLQKIAEATNFQPRLYEVQTNGI